MGHPATAEDVASIIDEPGLWQFLKTKRSIEELETALAVIREFKQCESTGEWLSTTFADWSILEQLEDYLCVLTDTDLDDVDDEAAKLLLAEIKRRAS